MFNLLSFRNTQRIKHCNHSFGAEQAHQIIFQRNIESGFTRVSLTATSSAQLIVNTPGLMPLRADDHQTACRSGFLIQLDIRTTAGHIRCDSNCPMNTGVRYNLRLHLMKLRVQYLMLYPALPQQAA